VERNRFKEQSTVAIAKLRSEDAVVPAPPVDVPLATIPMEPSAATFSSGVALRKIHVMIVLDRSGSMGPACPLLLAAAGRFSRLFADGRDWVGVVSYGGSVQVPLPLTDHFFDEASKSLSEIRCSGSTNTSEALETAQLELRKHDDPEAINAVVLFTDGRPNSMSANWPVKTDLPGKRCIPGQDPEVAATLMLTGGAFSAERAPVVLFAPVGATQATENFGSSSNPCFGLDAAKQYAYLPEGDLHGVPFTGTRPLERFATGPFAGKVRNDVPANITNAIANQMENAFQWMRSGPPVPTYTYVIGFSNSRAPDGPAPLDELRSLANDSSAGSFDSTQPPGLAVAVDTPEEFFPAFIRVREEMIRRATPHQR